MKKTYIAPTVNVVIIQTSILSGSMTVDTEKGTGDQYSRYNVVDFIEEEE